MTFTQPYRLWQPLAVILALFFAVPAQAAAVQDIRVLATGVDRSSARAAELALEYAKMRAVYLVARKMQVPDASSKLAALKPEQWKEIVRGATVLQTRREGEITYADVTVTVVNEPLRRILGLEVADATPVDTVSTVKGLLVLPVFVGKERPYVWESENRMNDPVRTALLRQGRGAVMVPAGDIEDRRLVDYQNALEVTAEQLLPMFTRYGIDEIIVAVTTLGAANTLEPSTVLLRRLGRPPATSRVEQIVLKPASEKETIKERAQNAAGAIATAATQIAGATSQIQQAKLQDAPNLPVTFRYATAHDLASMQEAVRTAPGVLQLVMPAISLQNMSGVLYLSGKREEVRMGLVKQGFIITDQGDGWIISVH